MWVVRDAGRRYSNISQVHHQLACIYHHLSFSLLCQALAQVHVRVVQSLQEGHPEGAHLRDNDPENTKMARFCRGI